MKDYVCSFLSRLALPGLMSLTLLSPALALADTITAFGVSGTAENTSGGTLDSCANGATCDYSGMFQIDTTTGVVESMSITFPGVPTIDSLVSQESYVSYGTTVTVFSIFAVNSSGDNLQLLFFTVPPMDSLVGFTKGTIFLSDVNPPFLGPILYSGDSGTITPVPEPSSLMLLAGGIGLLVGLARRFGKQSAIH